MRMRNNAEQNTCSKQETNETMHCNCGELEVLRLLCAVAAVVPTIVTVGLALSTE